MSWTIRFDSFVNRCSDGTIYPSLLSHQTSSVALLIHKNVIKSCIFYCFWVVVWCDFCYFVFVFFNCCGSCICWPGCRVWIIMYLIFAAFVIRYGVLLCNHIDFLPTRPIQLSRRSFLCFDFHVLFIKIKIDVLVEKLVLTSMLNNWVGALRPEMTMAFQKH